MASIRLAVENNDVSDAAGAGACCPLCQQAIPHEQSETVRLRIAAAELEHAAKFDERLSASLAGSERRAAAQLEIARVEAEAARAAAHVQLAEAHSQLAAARDEAMHQAELKVAARIAEIEAVRLQRERELADLRAEQAAAEAVRLAQEKDRLAAAKDQFERDKIAAVQAAETKAFEDKQKLHAKMADLQRQLENKTAQDLGNQPEVDLFELLKAEFPEDRISRVEKGAAGADVVHDIYHNGRSCGRIVYDSKNSSAWRNDYISKLRADQAEAKADHAVLCTKAFPANAKELHTIDGVLIVAPAAWRRRCQWSFPRASCRVPDGRQSEWECRRAVVRQRPPHKARGPRCR